MFATATRRAAVVALLLSGCSLGEQVHPVSCVKVQEGLSWVDATRSPHRFRSLIATFLTSCVLSLPVAACAAHTMCSGSAHYWCTRSHMHPDASQLSLMHDHERQRLTDKETYSTPNIHL